MSNGRESLVTLVALVVIAVLAVAVLPKPLGVIAAGIVVLATIAIVRSPETPRTEAEPPPSSPLDDMAAFIGPLNEGVLLLSSELTVLAANPAAATIAGRPVESMLGVSLIQAVRNYDLVELARDAAGEPEHFRLSGSERDVVATAVSMRAGDTRFVLCIQDVTELLQAQRARSELVANVSHELRTPIAAARALAETLHAGVDEPHERDRFLARLAEELERLGNIVQRLLRLARLESGAEPFAVKPLDAPALLEEAASRITPVAEQRQIRVEVTPTPGVLLVYADHDRVLEVLSNLLDNAVRHSPEAATVELQAVPDQDFVRFEVNDHGPGIPPVDRERIFERFYTGDRSRTPGAGSGLGLAIARHIVQQLGGRIWVAERATPGAAICFTLPAHESSGRTDHPSDDRGDGRRG